MLESFCFVLPLKHNQESTLVNSTTLCKVWFHIEFQDDGKFHTNIWSATCNNCFHCAIWNQLHGIWFLYFIMTHLMQALKPNIRGPELEASQNSLCHSIAHISTVLETIRPGQWSCGEFASWGLPSMVASAGETDRDLAWTRLTHNRVLMIL